MKKRILSAFLCIVVMFTAVLPVYAIDPIDLEKNVTLTIHYHEEQQPLPGVEFKLYRIADTSDFAEFTLTDEFDDYPITVTDHDVSSWNELAFTLKSYIAADQPQPVDNGVTDENGVVSFPNTVERLRPGLYLVS